MATRRKPVLAITLVLVASALGGRVAAQEGDNSGTASDDHTLVLLSVDETRPALFQALAPGDDPVTTNFETRLDIPLDGEQMQNVEAQSVIYVAIENTGWSVGAVGLIGGELDPDETYIALELWERMENSCCATTGRA